MTFFDCCQRFVLEIFGKMMVYGCIPIWFVFCSIELGATELTLARLSFWVPPERMVEFEATYQKQVRPFLKTHGLVSHPEYRPVVADSVFIRAFEFHSSAEFVAIRKALFLNQEFDEIRRMLGTQFGTSDSGGLIRGDLKIYKTPKGSGQQVVAGSGRGTWRTFGVIDGLAYNRVRSMVQDREGLLWFGTDGGGVSCYNGQTFTTFTTQDGLSHNTVRSIIQDREGTLWFGTDGGVSCYNGQTFTTFTTQDGLADNRVWSIIEDKKGIIWVGTQGGVSRYDPSASRRMGALLFTTITPQDGLVDKSVRTIFEDREGMLWFGTWGGISRYDPSVAFLQSTGERFRTDSKRFVTLTTNDGLANNRVRTIFEDREGIFWFATHGGGVSRYDGQTFATFTTQDGLVGDDVRVVFQDREGLLWFGTSSGISCYNGETFKTFTTEDGLVHNGIWAIVQDREGLFWFGTGQGGVSCYDGQTFVTFTTEDGLADNNINAIFQDREGVFWLGTHDGLSRYDGETFTTFTTEDGLGYNAVRSIVQDREGMLWFGHSRNGISRYDGQMFTAFTRQEGLAHDRIWALTLDSKGMLWAGTGNAGVSRYDGEAFTTFTTEDGLAYNTVRSVIGDRKERLWFGTDNGGVSCYDGETFTTFTTEDGLANNRILSIFEDREGAIWFGTGGGVSRFDGKAFTTFTTEDGLVHNEVWSILQDRDGMFWFGTIGGGVSRYDGKTFTTVTIEDGLANNRILSILQDREGLIWIGSLGGGVTRYRPGPSTPPPVSIDAVVADRRYENVSDIAISSGIALTMFEFHGMSFKTRPDEMVYRYRLTGYDTGWQTTRNRRVEYENLPVGQYTFEVEAVDRDLIYSRSPATVGVRVHLPYERLGLVLALGFSIVLVGWQTVRVIRRDRRLFAINQDLEIKSAEADAANQAKSTFLTSMSHEIRTPLNAILGYAQLMETDPSLSVQHRQSMQAINNSGSHLLNLINDVLDLSKIEAGRDELQREDFDLSDLVLRLGDMFRLRCAQKGLAFEVTQALSPLPVRGDQSKLRQVLVNLLGNAVKFTDRGSVALRLEVRSENCFYFEVFDTGPGIQYDRQDMIFDPFHQEWAGHKKGGTGLGLAIADRYVKLMGGQLKVASTPGVETRFTFVLNLPPALGDMRLGQVEDQVVRLAQGDQVEALVVDDVAENRDILTQMLLRMGVNVRAVESGKLALKQVSEKMPDIVFMDMAMPVLSGEKTMHKLFERYGRDRLKIVAVSAFVLDHPKRDYLEAGFDDFISKPIDMKRLHTCLADLLGVRFEYDLDVADLAMADRREAVLPESIFNALKNAAERHNMSRLKMHLDEAEALGEAEKHLVAPLRRLQVQYNMKAILEVLKEIRHD